MRGGSTISTTVDHYTYAPASRTAQAWVADVLRERIITGMVPVGGRLRQVDVASELGVSTTPVREAFRSLVTEGLVQIDEHRGVIVRRLTIEECIEMQELIALVESENLLHSVPLMDRETIDQAEAIRKRMARAGNRYALLNRDLHLTLARPSRRARALALLTELLTLSALHVPADSARIERRREQAADEHRALVSAARAGDAELAAHIVREHCQPMLNLLKRDLADAAGRTND